MKRDTELGSSSLAFVLLLFSFGLLMLNGLQKQLDRQQTLVASETSFLKRYSSAVSALAWGTQQHWQPLHQWQCQQQARIWRVCVILTPDGKALMAAYSFQREGQTSLTLWRWGNIISTRWVNSAHGWADFCPLKEVAQCQLPP